MFNNPIRRRQPVALCAAGALALLLISYSLIGRSAAPAASSNPKPALTVSTLKPSLTELPLLLAANGNIAAWQEALVGSEANGLRLSEVWVDVGDRVRAGQVLARFASGTAQAELAQARASLAEAEANAAEAAGNADRARSLQGSGALSQLQINQYLTAAQTAQARVASAQAALTVQQLRLQHTDVLAPDSGIISSRSATVGAVLPAGTELFRLIRQGRLEWRAQVTASEIARINIGTPVRVTTASGAQLQGRVRMIAPTVDPQTRTALVYADLPNAMPAKPAAAGTAQARAGMFAQGEFELGSSAALTVPQQAVVVRDGFSYVFRLGADGRVSQLKVQTGRRLGERLELLSGVDGNAELVASGAGFLNDGDLVKKVAAESNSKSLEASVLPAPAASK